jgi:subfamily B ATP-binding cassette protein MsbA
MGYPLAKQTSRELYFRLLGYLRPYWKAFSLAVVGMILTAATEPMFPALMKPLLDGSFVRKDPDVLYWVPLALVGLFVLRGALTFFTSYALAWVSNHMIVDLRNDLFRRLLNLPTRFFDNHSSGEVLSKVAYDVAGVNSAGTTVLTVLLRDSLAVIGLLAWLLYLNWQLTLITLIIAPGVALVIKLTSKRLRRMSLESMRVMGEVTHVLEESIECHKVVKIFGGQPYEAQRFDRANQAMRGFNMRQTIAASVTAPMVQLFAAIALAIIIAMAIRQSAADQFTVGEFVSFITAMLMLLTPIKHLADINAPLQRGLASAESVFTLMDEPPETDAGTVEIGRAKGDIRYEHVSFEYAGASRPALEDVSLDIAAGQTVALVGPSGAGKTTLVNLLPRFYAATGGRILLDGHPIDELTLASLRQNVALVSQDVVLFNDTVAANIAYGAMGGASPQAIEHAAAMAHALDFIREMPLGFDTMIGENGVRLSGGQRQRLAIARAFLKDAPVLVLDEATSALDSEAERHIQAALAELMRGRTTLVIAHRLSTVERADRIVAMARGRIVEYGTHAELLARDGLYARLYRIQFEDIAEPESARA